MALRPSARRERPGKPARPDAGRDLIRQARTGPAGPAVAALFDLDRTLIDGYSAIAFFSHGLLSGQIAAREAARAVAATLAFQLGRIEFSTFLGETMAAARGCAERTLCELGEAVFERRLASRIYPDARRLIDAHRRRGHFLAIVTSATRYQVEPIARELGIEYVACSGLEVRGGHFTGRVLEPACHGRGKLAAARRFAARHGFELSRSYFYSDSDEDLPLLEAVGRPRPVNPNRRLADVAAQRNWPTHAFAPPAGQLRRRLDDFGARWRSRGGPAPHPEVA